METQEAEIEVFKRTNEEHLDRFDAKFEQLSAEFTKIKTENIELKEKERAYLRQIRDFESQLNIMKDRCKAAERHSEDLASQLYYD